MQKVEGCRGAVLRQELTRDISAHVEAQALGTESLQV